MEDEYIYKSHNKALLFYHLVFPLKYRKDIFTKYSGETLVKICREFSERYEFEFIKIGYESGHVHFVVQSILNVLVSQMVRTKV